jgi:protein SCO1/2
MAFLNGGRRRLLAAALLAGAALTACDRGDSSTARPQFHATDITGADFGRHLELPDQDGRVRTLDDFKGKVTLLFFGFTQCPDVCPTTLAELAQVKKDLGAAGDRIQGLFVTVDPERDTPEVLKGYVSSFDPSFVALRGSPEQTAAAAKEFKVFYAKVPGKDEASYTMDHTAGSYVLDASGRIRLFERYNTPPQALADDLKRLM